MSTVPKDTNFLNNRRLNVRGEIKEFQQALVMGILNLTPDSFYDGGQIKDKKNLSLKIASMIDEGVDIIDIGSYSSRPGAEDISIEEEEKRLLPSLNFIRQEFPDVLLSIDTFRSQIASKAIDIGADIINDISGGMLDPKMMQIVGQKKVPYVIMHMQGNPQTMQSNPIYENVVSDVYKFFSEQLNLAQSYGIKDVILDPGFGFGKNLEDNYRLLKSIHEFKVFNCMLLSGVSRKSMINKVLDSTPKEALYGTVALNTICLLNGADILRVHDVKAAKDALNIVSYYQNI